jgi:polyferredoxin
MTRTPGISEGISPARRRRLVQLVFIFVNLALVETHLPGPLWLAIGGIFWLGLLGVTLAGSGLVCGSMCWIGAIQDIFEPFARPRVRLNVKLGRAVTLTLLVLWMPVGWIVLPGIAAHDRMPIDFSLAWERHLFQFALAALAALSVVVLGKRGICRYLCPFNAIVATLRRTFVKVKEVEPTLRNATSTRRTPCASACAGCFQNEHSLREAHFEGSVS